jgi:cephalosporin hydroxylase
MSKLAAAINDSWVGRIIASMPPRVRQKIASATPWRDGTSFNSSYDEALAAGGDRTEFGKVFFAHKGREIHKWIQYLRAYDEQFGPYRHGFPLPDGSRRPLRILEIGVAQGGSLQLWREFFGPEAVVFGIDIDPRVKAVDDPDLEVRVGSQTDPEFLRRVVAEMGGVDIVLDDGSHQARHIRTSFDVLFPLLSDGGLYAVEDLHASYWWRFGGGYRRRGTFIEVVKQLIDDMHAWYHSAGDKVGVAAATQIPKITVYDSIAFIEKAGHGRPVKVRFGQKSF